MIYRRSSKTRADFLRRDITFTLMQMTAAELAELVEGTLEGNPDEIISHPAKIEEAGPGSVSFLGNMRYENYLYETQAAAILVPLDFEARRNYQPTLIRVKEVYTAVGIVLATFDYDPGENKQGEVSAQASVADSSKLHPSVHVGRFTVIEPGVEIGEGGVIMDQVYIGPDCKLGSGCVLYPGVRLMHGCLLGDNVVVHANTVIGGDGFGFAPRQDGSYTKIAQVGNVIIEDEVEIGNNCSIDRATMGSTIIRRGVKLDNLIQVGHNVEIGAHTVIAAQAGIAGSTKIGAGCMIGGQAGFAGHLNIADNSGFQAQSGVAGHVTEEGKKFFGSPAFEYGQFVRSSIVFRRLPELDRRVDRLEKAMKDQA